MSSVGFTKKNKIKHLLSAPVKNTKVFKVYSVQPSSLELSEEQEVPLFRHCICHSYNPLVSFHPEILFGKSPDQLIIC